MYNLSDIEAFMSIHIPILQNAQKTGEEKEMEKEDDSLSLLVLGATSYLFNCASAFAHLSCMSVKILMRQGCVTNINMIEHSTCVIGS